MTSIVEALATNYPQYTEHPHEGPGMVYPNHGFQLLSTAVTLVGMSALFWLFCTSRDRADVVLVRRFDGAYLLLCTTERLRWHVDLQRYPGSTLAEALRDVDLP